MLNPMRRNPFAEELGYEEQTTFNRAFNEWKSNVDYVTELCMVLN